MSMLRSTFGGIENVKANDHKDESFQKDVIDPSDSDMADKSEEGDVELQHESVKTLKELQEENAELEIVINDLSRSVNELASKSERLVMAPISVERAFKDGLLSQQSYDKHVELSKKLRLEINAAFDKIMQAEEAKYSKFIAAIEKSAGVQEELKEKLIASLENLNTKNKPKSPLKNNIK